MRVQPAAILLGVLSCACGGGDKETTQTVATVPSGSFAMVDDTALAVALLGSTPDPSRADKAKRIVRDELFRKEATELSPHRARVVSRGVLARKLIETIEAEAARDRVISGAELKAEYETNWLEYDRPRAVRTVQVFFPVGPMAPDGAQFEKAERVLAAVRGTHNLAEFGAAARPLLSSDKEIRAFEMPPLAADGRIVPILPQDFQVSDISSDLAKAVSALANPGDISDVVGTADGFHIFFVTDVIPEKRVPFDEVRSDLKRAVISAQVTRQLEEISEKPRARVVRRRDDISRLLSLVQQGQ